MHRHWDAHTKIHDEGEEVQFIKIFRLYLILAHLFAYKQPKKIIEIWNNLRENTMLPVMESAHVEYEIKGRKRFDNEFSKEMRLENDEREREKLRFVWMLLLCYIYLFLHIEWSGVHKGNLKESMSWWSFRWSEFNCAGTFSSLFLFFTTTTKHIHT